MTCFPAGSGISLIYQASAVLWLCYNKLFYPLETHFPKAHESLFESVIIFFITALSDCDLLQKPDQLEKEC